ncbi:hypothetical protein BDF22DRAFT_743239 [Syncephalis plumigaleata]|nr:hypothetical protein BDF22DRAFT_743239 [Syncephalis plumigaleata]
MSSVHASRNNSSWLRTETLRVDDLSRDAALAQLSEFLEHNAPSGMENDQVHLTIGTAYQLELVRCSLEGKAPPPPPEFQLDTESAAQDANWTSTDAVAEEVKLATDQHAAVDVVMMDGVEETPVEETPATESDKKKKKKKKKKSEKQDE